MANPATSIRVDALAKRVMQRCDHLSGHTQEPGRITRLYLSPAIRAIHVDLSAWMREIGMDVRIDAAGNLVGRLAAAPDTPAEPTLYDKSSDETQVLDAIQPDVPRPVLLLGSHIDTVPNAGKYDGLLGVIVALAVAERLQELQQQLPFDLDVVAFSEEEGVRFSKPYLGSAAIAGRFDPAWLNRRDNRGQTMHSVITEFGLDPTEISNAAYNPQQVLGFIEMHVEQGPVLERLNKPVGVVNAIAGQSRLILRFSGQAGHAGTTPMYPRQDALVSAAHLIAEVQDYGRSIDGLRATVGYVNCHPNVRNVIPGDVEVSLDVRHAMDDVREIAVDALLETATRIANEDGVAVEVLENQPQPATEMDTVLNGVLSQAMDDAGHEPFDLLSGAGHDAVAMAEAFPVAMLFVRHPDGVSHNPNEQVHEADVAVSIDVLTRAVQRLASQVRESALT
ncbi:MAG: Zn-dependent hydrolase [Planctomycetota bacterium]